MDSMTTELSAYYMPSTALRLLEVVLNISSKDSLSIDEERTALKEKSGDLYITQQVSGA